MADELRLEAAGFYKHGVELVVETAHGIYSPRGWGYVHACRDRGEAIRTCREWDWHEMRIYNNVTGEVIYRDLDHGDDIHQAGE
jgi:hypothetical protein